MLSIDQNFMFRILLLFITLLLAGCPDPNRLITVESSELATENIGFNLRVRQSEDDGTISVTVHHRQTDGAGIVANVRLSSLDSLSMSVVGQEVDVRKRDVSSSQTEFTVNQSSLRLPATFRIKLNRSGIEKDALDTYVSISAVFETISPTDGTVFDVDGMATFAWTMRDGDGNSVAGAEAIQGIWTELHAPEILYPPNEGVYFDTTSPGQDGNSKVGTLPSMTLVPPDVQGKQPSEWELNVNVSGINVNQELPVTVEFDPALANTRTEQVFGYSATAYPRDVRVTVR